MPSISYLATRKGRRNDQLAPWLLDEQLTVKEGLTAMSTTNAWITSEEIVKGSIMESNYPS